MADDGHLGGGGGEGPPQEPVAGDGRPHGPHVVAELPDLGRRLVHKGQGRPPGGIGHHPHRTRPEQRIAGPSADLRVGRVDPMPGDQQMESGRVPPPHFQPVDSRQRHLNRPVRLEGAVGNGRHRPLRLAAGQGQHFLSGSQPVGPDGPQGVLEPDDGGVGRLELGSGERQSLRVEIGFQTGHGGAGLGRGGLQPGGQLGMAGQNPHADRFEPGGGVAQTGRAGRQRPESGVDVAGQRAGVGRADGRPAAQNGDDSTHARRA